MTILTPTANLLPPGLNRGYLEAEIDMSTAAASFLVGSLPANSAILSIAIELANTLTASTVKFGLGNASDPDAYYRSAGLTTASNAYQWLGHSDTNVTSDTAIALYAVDTNGAAAGTIGGGSDDSAKVRITYVTVEGF